MNLKEKIKYNISHRRAVIALEKEVLGKVSFLTRLHDFDKLIMICLFMPNKLIHKIHRFYSWHHVENKIGWLRFDEMLFDWGAARATKSDKPLNVLQVAQKYYPKIYLKVYNRLCQLNKTDL